MRLFTTIATMLLLSITLSFAGTVRGVIKDAQTKEPLIGANVQLSGTIIGATTDEDGAFVLTDVKSGNYTLDVTYLGYSSYSTSITVSEGTTTLDIEMASVTLIGNAIEVVANRARERETPVAFSDVSKEEMQVRLGSRDIPMVLNSTPSVYATPSGGGAGDARISVRGFNQRNIAIMINGVPVNDMENGWVYWSNWDGVGDATASIQMQRGLSAVNLATPSIGGTMNILTDPTAANPGGMVKQELGNQGFLKTTASFATGMIDGKWAFNGSVVRKIGDGMADATYTDAWAYYFGASYTVNANNRLELYAVGAPQKHGQNLYAHNIATYSRSFAEDLDDYDQAAFDQYPEFNESTKQTYYGDLDEYDILDDPRTYNENWAPVDPSYNGQQAVGSETFDRHHDNIIMERENFYHKPQVNLNWYTKLTDDLNLYTVAYYSGGEGGGTGTLGSISRTRPIDGGNPRLIDWNTTIANNRANGDGGSLGILRNSRNNQWTVGAISKATYQFTPQFKGTFGIDWRTAEIEHYREVRDLLGGQYIVRYDSDFWTGADSLRGLGDKVDYDFDNTVNWLGAFAQGEYKSGPLTTYGMVGWSQIKYDYTNNFRMAADGNGKLTAETDWIQGFQIKGGAGYRVNEMTHVYANAGYVSKVPIFDQVINDGTGVMADDPQNEKFISIEGGVNLNLLDGKANLGANFYYTQWNDRANSIGINNQDGTEGIVFLKGLDAVHQGIEVEGAYQPNRMLRLDAAASFGLWQYTDNTEGRYETYDNGQVIQVTNTYYVKDLKVGDAPQTQIAVAGSVYPVNGLMVQASLRYYMRHYAAFEPFGRTDPDDEGVDSWEVPSYGVVDLHAYYDLPLNFDLVGVRLFAHVFNALDTEYIQDATDNSRFNGFDGDHDADDAEVFFGLPRYFNVGLQLQF